MGTFLDRIKSRTKTIVGKVEKTQEDITFAQAGHPLVEEKQFKAAEPAVSGKLLVVGHETMFSQKVIDYALDMARRMSYEIVALNAAPLSCNAFKPFAASQKKLCDEFQQLSAENVKSFKQDAERVGIPFCHVVKFSEPEKALEMIQREYDHIDFVISDEQPAASEERVSDAQRPSQQVYVYSMI
ncbi:MAG: hypothetical protein LJE94_17710 [Deltaproteobacteria bacterium]|nr:hypothetical protein [Deltaproteobacteria bacterium]